MKNVPAYAQVPKAQYRELRKEMINACAALSFDFRGTWDLMIDMIERRHANVAKGRAKNELTLPEAVKTAQKEMWKTRADIANEQVEAREAVSESA